MPDFLFSEQEGVLIFSQNGMLHRNPETGKWGFRKLNISTEEMASMNFKKVEESKVGSLIASFLDQEEARYETEKNGYSGNR